MFNTAPSSDGRSILATRDVQCKSYLQLRLFHGFLACLLLFFVLPLDFPHVIFHLLFSIYTDKRICTYICMCTHGGTLFLGSHVLWMRLIQAKYGCMFLYVYSYKHINKYFHDTILAMETGFLKCSCLLWLTHQNFNQETSKHHLTEYWMQPFIGLTMLISVHLCSPERDAQQ